MKEKNGSTIVKNLIWTAVSAALAVLTVRMVLEQSRDLSVSELVAAINSSDKFFFILGVLAAAMYIWFEGVAIRCVLKNIGYRRGAFNGLLYSTSDVYFSAITPSATGGQPASAFFMIRDGVPAEMVAAVLVLNLTMYTLSIVVLGVFAIIISPRAFAQFSSLSKFLITVGFAALSFLTLIFVVLLKKGDAMLEPVSRLVNFLYDKKIIKEKERKLARLEKAGSDYRRCSDMISGRKRILFCSFLWNFLQRGSQMVVSMLVFRSLGGARSIMASVFAKQCLVTIGYNFVPIPGGIGISDYLMLDGFGSIMSGHLACSVELISRGVTFYMCVLVSGLITLIGYFVGRNKN